VHILVNGVRLFVDVANAGLVPDGDRMREKPVLLMLHGGPGFDHVLFKDAFSALSDVAQVSSTIIGATGAARETIPRRGTSPSGATT
jgi:hypothetical protein